MIHVSALSKQGIGKSCIIIGGGESIADFDFSTIPDGFVRINCNYPYHGNHVDYMVYWDKLVADEIEVYGKPCELIGYKHVRLNFMHDSTDFFYKKEDVPMYDTGLNSLYIASEIMKFDTVYLVGYDYTGDHYHTRYEKRSREKYFSMVNDKYDMKWRANITNLNKYSKLDIFNKKTCIIL